jgi:glyoxylate utilization-related uncharacterized protein
MFKRTLTDLEQHEALGFYKTKSMRIHGKEETRAEKFRVDLTTLLPAGGAEYTYEKSPSEKFYYVMDGEITVSDRSDIPFVLHQGESLSIAPYEGRALKNISDKPATVLIVTNYPD